MSNVGSENDPFPGFLTMKQVAAKLGKSVRWLQEHIRKNPCGRKMGRTRVFTPSDFAKLIRTFPEDEPSAPIVRTSRVATRGFGRRTATEAGVLAELERLRLEKKRHKPGARMSTTTQSLNDLIDSLPGAKGPLK